MESNERTTMKASTRARPCGSKQLWRRLLAGYLWNDARDENEKPFGSGLRGAKGELFQADEGVWRAVKGIKPATTCSLFARLGLCLPCLFLLPWVLHTGVEGSR